MSAKQTNTELSREDMENIEEYETLANFSEVVLAAHHSQIITNAPANSPLLPPTTTTTTSTTTTTTARIPPRGPRAAEAPYIDFRADYYKDLGVDSHVVFRAIDRAYRHKMEQFDPNTTGGRNKRAAGGRTRRRAEEFYVRAKKAHQILSDHRLRRQYDEGRIITAPPVAAVAAPPPITDTTTPGPGAALYGPMGTISFDNKMKAAAREGKQVDDEEDGAVSDTDSVACLYWGAKGNR